MFEAANDRHDAAGPRRAQQVLGGAEIGAAVFVVDDDEVEAGVGAHLDDRRRGDAVEDAAQALAAAQHLRQARVERAVVIEHVHARCQSSRLAISAPSAMLASLA